MGGKVGENPAALRAAVFSLSSKNLRGAFKRPPPPAGRGLNDIAQKFWKILGFQKMINFHDVQLVNYRNESDVVPF